MRLHRIPALGLTLVGLLAVLTPCRADLLGSVVTGTLNFGANPINYFNPANGFVPAGTYGNSAPGNNTVIIGPIIEFGYVDNINTDTADFTGTTLTVKDVANSVGS